MSEHKVRRSLDASFMSLRVLFICLSTMCPAKGCRYAGIASSLRAWYVGIPLTMSLSRCVAFTSGLEAALRQPLVLSKNSIPSVAIWSDP